MDENGEALQTAAVETKRKKLVRTRGGHKAYTTKVMNESGELLKPAARDADAATNVENELLTNYQVLLEKIEDLKLLNENILKITLDADYNHELMAAEDYKRTSRITRGSDIIPFYVFVVCTESCKITETGA